jgi:hypothetical protein
MPDVFPDIEIYVKEVDVASIIDWLEQHFRVVDRRTREHAHTIRLALNDSSIKCLVVEKAVKGGFTSIWFKSAETPWQTDRECAKDAVAFLHCEVRCNAGSWDEDCEDDQGWLRITEHDESRINWI